MNIKSFIEDDIWKQLPAELYYLLYLNIINIEYFFLYETHADIENLNKYMGKVLKNTGKIIIHLMEAFV